MKLTDSTLSEILHIVPRLQALWEHLGVDIPRYRDNSLTEVCCQHDLDPVTVTRMLGAFHKATLASPAVIVELLTLEELCDYIQHRHKCLLLELTELDELTYHAIEQYGGTSSLRIRSAFLSFSAKFINHLHKEATELLLDFRGPPKSAGHLERIARRVRIASMAGEHRQVDEALAKLDALAGGERSRGLRSPDYRKISTAVSRLHQIVHEVIYIENQVLFPKALSHWSVS